MFEIKKSIKLFAFDLDGTLYLGDNAIPGAVELIHYLKERYKVVFFTNNSSKTAEQIYVKLKKLKIVCNLNEVYTSSSATAGYLKETGINNIYLVGTENFRSELQGYGINIIDDDSAENVVVALDFDFNYNKITIALSVLLKGGKFIVCNEDRCFPVGKNKFLPGCGAIAGAIGIAAGKRPDFITGKPATYILTKISKDFSVKNGEIVIVGDTFESDIVMALNYKSKAIYINPGDKKVKNENVFEVKDLFEFLSSVKSDLKDKASK